MRNPKFNDATANGPSAPQSTNSKYQMNKKTKTHAADVNRRPLTAMRTAEGRLTSAPL